MSVFVIAEAGVNHNGSLDLAKKLIDVAADSGAGAVKFQTFRAEALVTRDSQKAQYQQKNSGAQESQYQMLEKLELDESAHIELMRYCNEKDILFLSTPFDIAAISMLDHLGMPIFKIPSGEITNLPYLRHIASLKKKVILSTGMADLQEVEDAVAVLTATGMAKEDITLLHATSEYPCPMNEVNLKAMVTMKEAFGVDVGYSDHTLGIEVPVAAVALGAVVIEKHFTLSREMDGPDHKASLEPAELKSMIQSIRNVEKALGSGIKVPSESEIKNKPVVRKSIVARVPITKGEIFNEDNLTAKRPGTGVSPMQWDELLGQVAQKDYGKDELI